MPLCAIHLLALHPTTPSPIQTFLSTLQTSTTVKPLTISRVLRWIILPTTLSTSPLLAQNIHWDLLLILPSTTPLRQPLKDLISHEWTVVAGIPSRLLTSFATKNKALLHPDPSAIPKLTGALDRPRIAESPQALELSAELQSWIQDFSRGGGKEGGGPVSMLNLLSFKPGMKESYLEYGKAFAESIGAKRGGDAKIVGTVVSVNGVPRKTNGGEEKGDAGGEALWDEVALAHYPSLTHFADMLASEDYQAVNQKFRVPALRDTFILCTSEVGIEELMGKAGGSAKL